MHAKFPGLLWLGIGLIAVAGLALAGLNLYQALAIGPALEQDRALVTHTFEVIETTQKLQLAMQDAERGQRTYLITNLDAALAPYRAGIELVAPTLAKLKELTSDNPEQQRRWPLLESQIAVRLESLKEGLDSYRAQGLNAARAIIESNRGVDAMRAINDLIASAIETENALLAQRLARAGEDESRIGLVAESGVLLTVLIFALGALLIYNALQAWLKQQKVLEQTRAALAQSQKMETLGQLSGGIAHDFNNMLAVIKGGVTLLNRRLTTNDPDVRRFIDGIEDAANRAAALTQRLLAFSRRQPLAPKPLDPNRLVADMSELLRRSLGEETELETVLAGGVWAISTDANQLENALLNLAVNARDAMPGGGKLTVETANVYLDEAYARVHDEVKSGQYVMIAVSDTGTGMSEETARNAFEPFFTTKGIGQGTGLGLSQVYGFVKQSAGHVKIYSEVGKGTTVKIYLPRHAGTEREAREVTPLLPITATQKTILWVEDEENVRVFTAEILTEIGYRVIQAPDGGAALKILGSEPAIDLLFTDVGLPNPLNGRQLADEACRRKPGLKVLFTTGYARNAIVHHGRLDPGVELIVKPFTQGELAQKLQKVLSV